MILALVLRRTNIDTLVILPPGDARYTAEKLAGLPLVREVRRVILFSNDASWTQDVKSILGPLADEGVQVPGLSGLMEFAKSLDRELGRLMKEDVGGG